MQRLGFVEERRLDQNENADSNIILAQKFGGATKLVERHPFVQFFQDSRMCCLQTHRHFQLGCVAEDLRRSQPRRLRHRESPCRVPLPGGARGGLVDWRTGFAGIGWLEQIAKIERRFADQRRMTLNNHPLEGANAFGNRDIVLWRDCTRIEEAAAVVEFDLAESRAGVPPALGR